LTNSSARKLQIGTAHKIANMLKIPYFIIGQLPSADLIMQRIYGHIANKEHKKKPLVMAFVGPSGHDKTEMAMQMGDLLSVKHIVIDCAQVNDRMDLLGASNGYHRSDQGSQLNNFLGDNDGERGVVFLEELDKSEKMVRNALLVVTEKGEYVCVEE
jgi:ATP-dependent Clp protease ATP-binding subunit ClpA